MTTVGQNNDTQQVCEGLDTLLQIQALQATLTKSASASTPQVILEQTSTVNNVIVHVLVCCAMWLQRSDSKVQRPFHHCRGDPVRRGHMLDREQHPNAARDDLIEPNLVLLLWSSLLRLPCPIRLLLCRICAGLG